MNLFLKRARWLLVFSILLYAHAAVSQQIVRAEYFIDNDPGTGSGITIAVVPGDSIIANFTAPLNGIEQGFHLFSARVQTSDSLWQVGFTKLFYVNPYEWPIPPSDDFPNPLVYGEYFIDTDPGEGMAIPFELPILNEIDIHRTFHLDTLPAGVHTLGLRVKQLDGTYSLPFSVGFTVYGNLPCSLPLVDFSASSSVAGQVMSFTNLSANLSANATYLWEIYGQDTLTYTSFHATHTFPQAGTYDVLLRVSNGNDSCTVSLIRQIEVGPYYNNQLLYSGVDTTCYGNPVILNAPAGSDYLWSNGETTAAIQVNSSGNYQVLYTDPNGNTQVSNEVYIHVYPPLEVELYVNPASNNQANGSAGVLVSGGSAWIYDYSWSSGGSLTTETDLLPGTYSLTVSDSVCPQVFSVPIGNILSINPGITAAEYFVDSDPGPGNATPIQLNWNDTVSSFVHIPTGSLEFGWHILGVRVKRNDGLWQVATPYRYFISPEIFPEPADPTLLTQVEVYFDEDPGTGQGHVFSVNQPQSELNETFNASLAGLAIGYHRVFVRAKNSEGWWGGSSYLDFLVDVALPEMDTTNYPLITGEYFFNSDPGEGLGFPFQIPIGDTIDVSRMVDISSLMAGTHRLGVRVKTLQGSWSLPSYTFLELYEANCLVPEVSFTASSAQAGQALLLTNTSTQLESFATYQWDIFADGTIDYTSFNASHVFSSPGSYEVGLYVSQGDSCFAYYASQVIVGTPLSRDIQWVGNPWICSNDSLQLTAPAGSNFLWNTGEVTGSIWVNQTGDYEVTYTDLNGDLSLSEPVHIEVYSQLALFPQVSHANAGLSNGSINVSLSGGTGYIHDFSWSNGGTLASLGGLAPGMYHLSVSDLHCPEQVSVQVESLPGSDGIIAAEYFTESDPGPGLGTAIPVTHATEINSFFQTSLSGQPAGLYSFYYRVKNDQGWWSTVRRLLVSVGDTAQQVYDTPVFTQAEYFFNTDEGVLQGNPINPFPSASLADELFTIDVSNLDEGIHRLLVRTKDQFGNWSTVGFMNFSLPISIEAPDTTAYPLVAGEIFFNEDPGEGNGIAFSVPSDSVIDILSTIPGITSQTGFYAAFLRVKQLDGTWSLPRRFDYEVYDPNCDMPVVDFEYIPANAGSPMALLDASQQVAPSATYQWDIGADGIIDYSGSAAIHTFAQPGIYPVALTVSNSFVCYSTLVQDVIVGPYSDNVVSLIGNDTICGGDTVLLVAPAGSNYLWNTGETTQEISVTQSGSYQVYYTNPQSVQLSSNTLSVYVYPELTLALEVSPASPGMASGSANVLVSGGVGLFYDYSWSTGETLPMAVGLSAGVYSFTASDAYCEQSLSVQILEESIPFDASLIAAEYFMGDQDPGPGNASSIPISYLDSIDAFFHLSFQGYPAGVYNLYFRTQSDQLLWSSVNRLVVYIGDSETLPQPLIPEVVELAYFWDTPDPGEANSALYASFTSSQSIDESFELSTQGIGTGTKRLSLRAKDSQGAWSVVRSELFEVCNPPTVPGVSADVTICEGLTIDLVANSIHNDVEFYWFGPNGFQEIADSLSIHNATSDMTGLYQVYAVRDGNCYSQPNDVLVTVQPKPEAAGGIIPSSATCQDTGIVVFYVPPILHAAEYEWSFPQGINYLAGNNTNNVATSLENLSGLYDLQVRGVNTCGLGEWSPIYSLNVEALPEPICPSDTILSSFQQSFSLLDYGLTEGEFVGPGVQGTIFDPLLSGPGVHEIHYLVETAGGCVGFCSFTITVGTSCSQPSNLTLSNLTSQSATITWLPGGSESAWEIRFGIEGFDPLSGGNLISGITANSYQIQGLTPFIHYEVYVRALCSGNQPSLWEGPLAFTPISSAPPILVSTSILDDVCSNGEIILTVTQGTAPYSFLWSNGETNFYIHNLNSDLYSVSISDAAGQSLELDFFIDSNPLLLLDPGIVHPGYGVADGSLSPVFDGGYPPYSYQWSNGATSAQLSSLPEGTYTLTLTEQTGCMEEFTFELSAPTPFQQQVMQLPIGWSYFSTYIDPIDPTMPALLAGIQGTFQIVKNYSGGSYWPLYSINTIGSAQMGQAYQIRMNTSEELTVEGTAFVPELSPITIPQGWSFLGYLRQTAAPINQMLAGIQASIEIVKNSAGQSYWPLFNVNTIGNMVPGQGYLLKLNASQVLTYPANSAKFTSLSNTHEAHPFNQSQPINTGVTMTIGIPNSHWEQTPELGSEIAAFGPGGELVGSELYLGENCALTIWGNDEMSSSKDGLVEGEKIRIAIRAPGQEVFETIEIQEWLVGNGTYETNQLAVVGSLSPAKADRLLLSISPNPVRNEAMIQFYLPQSGLAKLYIQDDQGRIVLPVVHLELAAGWYSETLQNLPLASGLYQCVFETPYGTEFFKMVVIP